MKKQNKNFENLIRMKILKIHTKILVCILKKCYGIQLKLKSEKL